jgi:hypothetical protein
MLKFTLPVTLTETDDDIPTFALVTKTGRVRNAVLSPCGTHAVDPLKTYGVPLADAQALSQLNKALMLATEAAINAGCKQAQETLGIRSGDVAGMHFADQQTSKTIATGIADYLVFELNYAGVRLVD